MPATEDQLKGLVKLAERDRSLVVKVETEEVVKQLMGQVEQLNKQLVATMGQLSASFAKNCNHLITVVDDQTTQLGAQLGTGVTAVQAATSDMKADAALIQTKITVDFKEG